MSTDSVPQLPQPTGETKELLFQGLVALSKLADYLQWAAEEVADQSWAVEYMASIVGPVVEIEARAVDDMDSLTWTR